MDLKEIGCEGVNCINLAQDRDLWQTLVSTFGFHKMLGILEWLRNYWLLKDSAPCNLIRLNL